MSASVRSPNLSPQFLHSAVTAHQRKEQLKIPRRQTAHNGSLISDLFQAGVTMPEPIRLSAIASSSAKGKETTRRAPNPQHLMQAEASPATCRTGATCCYSLPLASGQNNKILNDCRNAKDRHAMSQQAHASSH